MKKPARRQPVTSDDVARLAGVSKSAVSRTFTRDASASATMRQRVLKAAETLGYRPNPIARSLTTKRSAIIGVAMSYMDQLYAPLLSQLSERLTPEGFRLLLFKANANEIADDDLERIVQYNVDALILASVRLSEAFADRCYRAHVPVIQINPLRRVRPLSTITSDNRAGGRRIGEFLLAGGHRRIAFMAGIKGAYTSDARRLGFYDAMKSAGRSAPVAESGAYTFEGGLLAARKLLSGSVRPDAIFCANDSMACAAVDVARREFGLAVGSALSIVGFDDEPMAAWPGFGITTYTLPLPLLVERTIELMRGMWEDNDAFADVIVPGELVVRTSARLPT
jgi:DNA-binding LacI/PurR family transcriptional regulator